MATRSATEVAAVLQAKGMERTEKHHHMFRKRVDGVTTLVTRISHSSSEINNHLAKLMANQCCLRLGEFWELIDCPLTEEAWDEIVVDRCAEGRNPFLGS